MGWIFMVVGVLLMAFVRFRRAKQQGVWMWKLFFGLLAAVALFIGCVIVPLSSSNLMETHPDLLMVLIFGSILLFTAGVVVMARKAAKGWVAKQG